MKKWMPILLVMALMMGTAQAGETDRLYVGGEGFLIQYDPAYFGAVEIYGLDAFISTVDSENYMMIVPAQMNPEDTDGMLAEAVGGYGPEAVIGEAEYIETENGISIGSIQAELDGMIHRFYLADDGERVLCITVFIPEAEEEPYSALYDSMVETIRLVPVRTYEEGERIVSEAQYPGAGYSLWFPIAQIEPRTVYGHEAFVPVGSGEENETYMLVSESDVAPENADSLLEEATGGYESYRSLTEIHERALPSGMTVRSAEVELETQIHRYYLVKDAERIYCLTAIFPASGEVDYGMIFDQMVESMESVAAEDAVK